MKRKAPSEHHTISRAFAITVFGVKPFRLPWMRYLHSIQEKCPTTGTLHYQTCFYLQNPTTESNCNSMIPEDWKGVAKICIAHFTKNMVYCSLGKGMDPPDTSGIPGTEICEGIPPQQGCHELLSCSAALAASNQMSEIDPVTFIKYHRGLKAYQELHQEPYQGKRYVEYIWGPTLCGKTTTARLENPGAYWQTSSHGWFDGYKGQSTVILDDIEPGIFTTRELLHLMDEIPIRVKVKGAMVPLMASRIIMTSHFSPEEIVPKDRLREFMRRITKVRYMDQELLEAAS